MTIEKSGYKIRVTFTPDAGVAVTFDAKSKQIPGFSGDDKIDINTDGTGEIKEFAPGDQYEITDAQVTIIEDLALVETLRALINDVGSLAFASGYTSKTATFPNAWLKEIARGSVDLNGNPTVDLTFVLGGGASGAPSVA